MILRARCKAKQHPIAAIYRLLISVNSRASLSYEPPHYLPSFAQGVPYSHPRLSLDISILDVARSGLVRL